MSVKSNDGGGGGNSARPAVMLQISLLSCVFLVLYGGSGSYGRDRSVCATNSRHYSVYRHLLLVYLVFLTLLCHTLHMYGVFKF